MNAFIPNSLMPAYRQVFEMLTEKKGQNVRPKHDMFVGTARSINAEKSSLIQSMASFFEKSGKFRVKEFKRLVKGVQPATATSISKIMDRVAEKIKDKQDREALESIGNQEIALQLIGGVARRAQKPKMLTQLRQLEAQNPPKLRNKNEACVANLSVNPIHGMAHDRTKATWNLHRKQQLYPVNIRVQFHPNDGFAREYGDFIAYLPYGVLLYEAICMVEYETRNDSTCTTYIVFPKRTPKVGKHSVTDGSNFYAVAKSLFLIQTELRIRSYDWEDFEDPTEALLHALGNRLLPSGQQLCHEWFLPRAFEDGSIYVRKTRDLVRNHPDAIRAGKVAYDWYMQSTGVFTELGTYSVKFQDPGHFRATLTNLAMVSYQASAAYVTRNPLPSTLNIPDVALTNRGIMVTGNPGNYVHRFVARNGARLSQWEPLSDGFCLITDDAAGIFHVPMLFEGPHLSDNADGVNARAFNMNFGAVRELCHFTVFCVRTREGSFLAFVPSAEIRRFSSIYAVAANSLVARVNDIVEGYSYLDEETRVRLRVAVTRRVEASYRRFAADSSAASALITYGLGVYNTMFSQSAREFLRSMTPDFIGILNSSTTFMREAMLRTTNERLALTAAVGVSVGVVTYGMARDLSAISSLHPEMGPALSYMVRGGLEEMWLQSVTFTNPALGFALRGIVAAIEFTRDAATGVTPYSAAMHSAAAFLPPAIASPLHVLYNGARGYVDSHGTAQGTLGIKGQACALAIMALLVALYRMRGGNEPGPDVDESSQQDDQDHVDQQTALSALFKPVAVREKLDEIAPVPVLERAPVGDVNPSLRRSGVEVAIAALSLPWKPLCNNAQKGDTLTIKRSETVGPEVDLSNLGVSRSSTWLCWGGSRDRLPFHFENSLVNLVGGVYRRLLVPAMRVEGRDNTPVAWQAPPDFRHNVGLSGIIKSAVSKYTRNVQPAYVSWLNSRTAAQSRKYSEADRNSSFTDVLSRAVAQKSYKVSFFVKQEPTFNPSIRLIFPIEPLAELTISPFVRYMEKSFVEEMRSRLFKPIDRQSIFTGGFDSLEKGAAWSTIKDSFGVNYVFAVDCTSWDSFVPGDLLRKYRELYPEMISKVVKRQLTSPSHFEASKNGQFWMKAERHTCTQLSGSPDTYILNSIANAHILEEFMNNGNYSGQAMICGDDSLLTLKVSDPTIAAALLVQHFATYGLTAKVAYYGLDDPAIDFCSGHFAPVQQRVGSNWVNSFAWIPNPIKFIHKAFLIKTISEEDIDMAMARFLMTTYQMFKYTPDILNALIPKRLRSVMASYTHCFPELDYELELKYGGYVEDHRWSRAQNPFDKVAYEVLCQLGKYDAVYEKDSMFFSSDFEAAYFDMKCVNLMPDTQRKYRENVLQYCDPVPAVFTGKLSYASLLAANPIYQLSISEMSPKVIAARQELERSPYHTTLLMSPDVVHLKLHMSFRNPTDLFMQINSSHVPYVFVDPSTYLSALSTQRVRSAVMSINKHTQVQLLDLNEPGFETESKTVRFDEDTASKSKKERDADKDKKPQNERTLNAQQAKPKSMQTQTPSANEGQRTVANDKEKTKQPTTDIMKETTYKLKDSYTKAMASVPQDAPPPAEEKASTSSRGEASAQAGRPIASDEPPALEETKPNENSAAEEVKQDPPVADKPSDSPKQSDVKAEPVVDGVGTKDSPAQSDSDKREPIDPELEKKAREAAAKRTASKALMEDKRAMVKKKVTDRGLIVRAVPAVMSVFDKRDNRSLEIWDRRCQSAAEYLQVLARGTKVDKDIREDVESLMELVDPDSIESLAASGEYPKHGLASKIIALRELTANPEVRASLNKYAFHAAFLDNDITKRIDEAKRRQAEGVGNKATTSFPSARGDGPQKPPSTTTSRSSSRSTTPNTLRPQARKTQSRNTTPSKEADKSGKTANLDNA